MEFVRVTEELVSVAIDIQSRAFKGEYDEYAKREIPLYVNSHSEYFYIVRMDGVNVGLSSALKDPIAPDTFGLGWVCLTPEFQGKGLGVKLVDTFMNKMLNEVALAEKCTFILATNAAEKPFYKKLGFEVGNVLHCGAEVMTKVIGR